MSKQWYGNLTNRLEEGRNVDNIEVGTDITMYYWSDRTCYYVTEVTDQKHIKVKEYWVVADREKAVGMGHQDWVYFKTADELRAYMRSYGFDYGDGVTDREYEWVFRYGKWMTAYKHTEDDGYCTEREKKSLDQKGYFYRYYDLNGKVSFGRRDYYHDWEF